MQQVSFNNNNNIPTSSSSSKSNNNINDEEMYLYAIGGRSFGKTLRFIATCFDHFVSDQANSTHAGFEET